MVENRRIGDFSFCEESLVKVSRTFAINIKVLKGTTYRGILLAYLLCRIADTIEDDSFFPVDFKMQKLCEYSRLFPPTSDYEYRLKEFLKDLHFEEKTDDTALVTNAVRVFNEFITLPETTISVISKHVQEMALGMAHFQGKGSDGDIVFLEDKVELDRYCYFVAGTVGLMITSVFSENSRRLTPVVKERLLDRSVAFGLGLQVTNIAKDFHGDRERGWCYVPRSFFIEAGVDPLHDTFREKKERFINAHRRLINLALTYLDEALLYILDIPRTLIRYRLFCLWPLFMAVESLARLSTDQSLFYGRAVKISRNDIRRIVRNTSLAVMSNTALKHMYSRARREIR